jgi:hypothetical protein
MTRRKRSHYPGPVSSSPRSIQGFVVLSKKTVDGDLELRGFDLVGNPRLALPLVFQATLAAAAGESLS